MITWFQKYIEDKRKGEEKEKYLTEKLKGRKSCRRNTGKI
jgi:hypothetical protein